MVKTVIMLKHALRTRYDIEVRPGMRKRVSLGDLSLTRRKSGTYENVQILKKYLRRRNSISWPNSMYVEDDGVSEVNNRALIDLYFCVIVFH